MLGLMLGLSSLVPCWFGAGPGFRKIFEPLVEMQCNMTYLSSFVFSNLELNSKIQADNSRSQKMCFYASRRDKHDVVNISYLSQSKSFPSARGGILCRPSGRSSVRDQHRLSPGGRPPAPLRFLFCIGDDTHEMPAFSVRSCLHTAFEHMDL